MTRRTLTLFIVLAVSLIWTGEALAQQPTPTAVPGTVIVEWSTESEVNHAGFNVYRSEKPEGPYIKLNDSLIPASSDPITGGSYSFADTTARAGVKYYYKLEDVELDGTTTMHGPTEVVAQATTSSQESLLGIVVVAAVLVGLLGLITLLVLRRRRIPDLSGSPAVESSQAEKR